MDRRVHRRVRHRACVLSTTLSASMQRAGAGRWLVELLSELLVRVEFHDGQVEHYEGERDAEQVVLVERPSGDATMMSESYI